MNDILNNKGDLPTFVSIEISNRVRANDDDNSDEISEQDDSRKTIIDTNKEINKIKIEEKNKLLVFQLSKLTFYFRCYEILIGSNIRFNIRLISVIYCVWVLNDIKRLFLKI